MLMAERIARVEAIRKKKFQKSAKRPPLSAQQEEKKKRVLQSSKQGVRLLAEKKRGQNIPSKRAIKGRPSHSAKGGPIRLAG